VVEVTYNKNVISTEELLMHYFESHDPTQINRQGNDIGTQYRSIILYSTEEQKKAIDKVLQTFPRAFISSWLWLHCNLSEANQKVL
jgi:peptide methionine sulfoxide reductase msrA/msrB